MSPTALPATTSWPLRGSCGWSRLFLQELEPEEEGKPQEVDGRVTWYLLCHRQGDAVRAELSLPVVVNGGGRIELWRERIILPVIDLGQGPAPVIDSGPDLDVPVHRKAG